MKESKGIFLLANLLVLSMMLKMYTEIFKERAISARKK